MALSESEKQRIKEEVSKLSLREHFYSAATMRYIDLDAESIPVDIFASFYVVLSQYLKKGVKVAFGGKFKDIRYHFFTIRDSRTGKGELYAVTRDLAEALGLKVCKRTRLSDAGIFGTIDEKAIEYNYKHKLTPDNPEYKDPVVIGDLGNYDIIFFVECGQFLNPQPFVKEVLGILQEALDDGGHVSGKLRNTYEIDYNSTASTWCSTYYMDEIETKLIKQGYFQRNPPYIREISLMENHELRHSIIDLYKTNPKKIEEYNYKIQLLAQRIKAINNNRAMYMSTEAKNQLHHIYNSISIDISKASGTELRVLKSFSQTAIDMCAKIGAIHACMRDNYTTSIDLVDLTPANAFVRSMFNTIINKIEISDKQTDIEKRVGYAINLFREEIKHNPKLSKEDFTKVLQDTLKLGRHKARGLIDRMIIGNYLVYIKGDKNEKVLLLPEAVK